ncbi:hypothetical protein J6397_29805 [Rhodococcus qingshengii]|uniref:Uncharacterized protein n=1 Tax=Rhodococcus baikonurensis TaxID=172041 RepID=A0ABV5XST5_9NOCA|nr:hypothetical protein [Rhodococcus qingshengii]MBP1054347.1 hypothetical protein [Rhodococcus qingshengii]
MTTPGNLSKTTSRNNGDADVASSLPSSPALRVGGILMASADGRALPASVLATEARISAQSASDTSKGLWQETGPGSL